MMYWLAENLVPHVSGFNLFLYVTARAVFAVLTALSIGLMLGPWFINQMKKAVAVNRCGMTAPNDIWRKITRPQWAACLFYPRYC